MARAMLKLQLPPHIAFQPGKLFYRAGDHELSTVRAGQAQNPPASGNREDLFKTVSSVAGEVAAGLSFLAPSGDDSSI